MAEYSDSEDSSSCSSVTRSLSDLDSEENLGAVGIPVEPYQFKPLADENAQESAEDEDEDGLTPAILEARFENEVAVNVWCKCGHCNSELLTSALEFRCCAGKFSFEGIEVGCITDHRDFVHLIYPAVLEMVCPMLKDKEGKTYRFPHRGTVNAKNESYRATAYRFLIRWIFGSLGWNNARPLPACIYHEVRKTFRAATNRGYLPAEQRQ